MMVSRRETTAYVGPEPWERRPVFFTFPSFIICSHKGFTSE